MVGVSSVEPSSTTITSKTEESAVCSAKLARTRSSSRARLCVGMTTLASSSRAIARFRNSRRALETRVSHAPRPNVRRMNASVVLPTELGAGELTAWSEIQKQNPCFHNPFVSPGFAVAVGRVQPSARVAVLEDERGIAGVFPLAGGGSRVGKPICGRLSDAQALVHRDDFEWGAADLLKECDLDVWEFRRLIEPQWVGAGRVVDRERRSPIVELDLGYDAYVDGHPSTIKKINAQRRRLDRDQGSGRFELHSTDPAALERLRQWKS